MKKNEVINMVDTINERQIPTVIQEQFSQLSELRKNVEKATKKAELAQDSAESARNKSAGWFRKKEAIESLQEATSDLAAAQISATKAQEVSFEYQQRLGEITKYLFGLGATNMALNRSVVRELEMRLQGASEKDIDEFARQEIIGVVKQLKAQEDIMRKQSELTERVKEHENTLTSHEEKNKEYEFKLKKYEEHDREQDILLQKYAEKDKSQDEEITRQAAKDEELGKRIDEGEEKDKNQDEEITRQAVKDEELGKRIDEGEEKDRDQDKEIARQAAKDEELSKLINELLQSNLEKESQIRELYNLCNELSSKTELGLERVNDLKIVLLDKIDEKVGKREKVISYIIGGTALLISIVHLLCYLV